jgi:hypothetical protein
MLFVNESAKCKTAPVTDQQTSIAIIVCISIIFSTNFSQNFKASVTAGHRPLFNISINPNKVALK